MIPPAPSRSLKTPISRLALASLVLALICAAGAVSPVPWEAPLLRLNYHLLHLSWAIINNVVSVVAWVAPMAGILVTMLAFRRTRPEAQRRGRRLVEGAVLLLAVAFTVEFLSTSSTSLHGPYYSEMRIRMDALSAVRDIAEWATMEAQRNSGRWPPHLASLVIDGGLPVRDLRYRYSPTYELPSDVPNDWRELVSTIDAQADFIYLVGDLSSTLTRSANAAPLIVAYGKRNLPELPQVSWHTDTGEFEYAFAARPVSFVDGTSRLVSLDDLPKVFAAHNAARATLGLPPHTLDVPPRFPPGATRPL
jgi:hypothetical protein